MAWDGTDYKMDAQLRAEEIAEQEFGCDFYDLPDGVQSQVYQRGLDGTFETMMDRADGLRKAEREKPEGKK